MSSIKNFYLNLFNEEQLSKNSEGFSGPLDLLLSLIEEQKLDINELAISEVTKQYLKYLDTLEETRPEELVDFLVIATRLLLLKSKNLLPQLSLDEEQGPTLEDQLRLYKAFIEASKKLNKQWLKGRIASFRIEQPRRSATFVAPINFSNENLYQSMLKLISRLKPLKELPQTIIDDGITIKQKLENIRTLLKKNKEFSFYEVLHNAQNKTEIIITFLALLELVKEQQVALRQKGAFKDILVAKV